MKTIIKLLIVALLLNGTWRVGSAYWAHYQMQDKLQQIAQFAGNRTAAEVKTQAIQAAADAGVPVTPGEIVIHRTDREITIEVAYTRQLELFPRYRYPWAFSVTVKAWTRAY